jgi:transcription initiation factor TFIIIB Brf1 subunit/transcription initiation factor TFIIB
VAAYAANPNMQTVRDLAEIYEKTAKSIIGKLSREGVYQKSSYTTKTGTKPITKIEIVTEIADKLDLDPETVAGLEKSPKAALVLVRDAIAVVREAAMEVEM